MKDNISKQKGLPFSTSRSEEKANKKNTQKARRQDGKRAVSKEQEEFDRQFTEWQGDAMTGDVGCD